ncbi:hypothetical protein NPX13_g6392 [Xylaria arbuscula]|uniref:Uncharacterized protein n=1 Tax=Xylaria arbuscula TaxID=114810 RepID=A0A9W8TLG7_9PEZI|nr:hypothetical protein NPX13_g6392 [Xylaria arbuscula]
MTIFNQKAALLGSSDISTVVPLPSMAHAATQQEANFQIIRLEKAPYQLCYSRDLVFAMRSSFTRIIGALALFSVSMAGPLSNAKRWQSPGTCNVDNNGVAGGTGTCLPYGQTIPYFCSRSFPCTELGNPCYQQEGQNLCVLEMNQKYYSEIGGQAVVG